MSACAKAAIAFILALLMPAAVLAANSRKAEANAKTDEAIGSTDTKAFAKSGADKPMVLAMTIGDPEDSEMGLLGIAFKNYVLQASKGDIQIRLSYSGGLDADETFQFHRVQTGKLPLALGGVGNLAPMVRQLGVVTLPYIFPNVDAVIRGTTGKAAQLLNEYAEKAGLRILAWTYYGYRFLSNSKRPIKALGDMKGMRIRVPQSLVMIKTYRAFGSVPMPLAWPATRNALKNDLVDGQCYDYNGFRAMKFKDVGQKYITETHYIYNLQPLVINSKLFESLPDNYRTILVNAGQHIQDLSLQYQKEMNEIAKKALISEGVHISTLDDEDKWRQLAISRVWPEAADSLGGETAINDYLKACDLPLWEPVRAGSDAVDPASEITSQAKTSQTDVTDSKK